MVVGRTGNTFQCFDAGKFQQHPFHVTLKLENTAPFLPSKRSLPHIPKIGGEEMVIEPVADRNIVQIVFVCKEKFQEFHPILRIKAHIGYMQAVSVFVNQACMGVRRIGVVESQNLIFYRNIGHFQRRNSGGQVPKIFIRLFIQHSSATANEAFFFGACSIVASS